MIINVQNIQKILLVISLTSLFSTNLLAAQIFNVSPGETYQVKASFKNINAIEMKQFRIASAWATEGNASLKKDNDAGVVTFTVNTSIPFPIFIRDEDGDTYNLMINPESIPAQLITLIPSDKIHNEKMQFLKVEPWKHQLKMMAKSIANATFKKDGFSKKKINNELPLWKEVKFVHQYSYIGAKLIADEYSLSNTSAETLSINEREFVDVGKNVISVGVLEPYKLVSEQANLRLGPSHSVRVLVFRVRAE